MKHRLFLQLLFIVLSVSSATLIADWSELVRVTEEDVFVIDIDGVEGPNATLHFAWTTIETDEQGNSVNRIRYASSSDQGVTWSESTIVHTVTSRWARADHPAIDVTSDGNIHIAFDYINYICCGSINYYRSSDGGQTWQRTFNQYTRFANYPTLSSDGLDNLYMTWAKHYVNPLYVYFNRSIDSGISWSPTATLLSDTVPRGTNYYWDAEARSHLLDTLGTLHAIGQTSYTRSIDLGDTWEQMNNLPADFVNGGIYENNGEILIPGKEGDFPAFIKSYDGGNSWEGPLAISNIPGQANQILVDTTGKYYTIQGQNPLSPHYFVQSSDSGLTWSDPEYLGEGTHIKLLKTSWGELMLVSFWREANYAGFRIYQPPVGVDAPDTLSLWEKADFNYNFNVFGTGLVQVSFPADYVDANPMITVGNQTIVADTSIAGDRLILSFSVDENQWTTCTVPISIRKSNVGKFKAISAQLVELDTSFSAAIDAEDGELAAMIDSDMRTLSEDLISSERTFEVAFIVDNATVAEDDTFVNIYEKLASNYVHFKAGNKLGDEPRLVLLSEESMDITLGEPFNLEVKVTNMTQGQIAEVAIDGQFNTIDTIETNATGTHKTTHYLFYPLDFQDGVDNINIDVTVSGLTTTVPFTVNIH